jgi:nucleotide-binding universal stress UspA family protein
VGRAPGGADRGKGRGHHGLAVAHAGGAGRVVLRGGGGPGVSVKAEIGEGSAAQLLLDAALGAGLVVVGSRGYGGITGALLGSVGHALAQHSPCPVVIIRGIG